MKDFVANSAKDSESRLLITLLRCGIVKAPMNPFRVAGKDGTLFVGVIAHCDDVIEFLSEELVYRFRAVMGDVDTEFAHCCYRFRPNLSWRNSRACDFKMLVSQMAQQAFSHLASRGVAGAQYQNAFTVVHLFPLANPKKAVAAKAPASWATMKAGASTGLMPANVSLADRANVTAGFANDVEAVNQYAAMMYAATANETFDE